MEPKIIPAKLSVMKKLYKRLDPAFRDSIQDNSLCRLLNIEDADMPSTILRSVLEYYDTEQHVFRFQGHTLGFTLEDVLYLTALPIQDKAVIIPDVPDLDAFERVFGQAYAQKKNLSFHELEDIAANTENDVTRRKIAVLAVIFGAFIAPDSNKHKVTAACVKFFEDVDQVDTYAWGVALLSFMYHGMSDKAKKIEGNSWIVMVSTP